MEVFAKSRPAKAHAVLEATPPLKNERFRGTDLLIVRELTGGIYFDNPRGSYGQGAERQAVNTLTYSYDQFLRTSPLGVKLARFRREVRGGRRPRARPSPPRRRHAARRARRLAVVLSQRVLRVRPALPRQVGGVGGIQQQRISLRLLAPRVT